MVRLLRQLGAEKPGSSADLLRSVSPLGLTFFSAAAGGLLAPGTMKGKRQRGPRDGNQRKGGGRKAKRARDLRKLQEKRTREQQGGRLLKRPEIKGLDGDPSSKVVHKKKETLRKLNNQQSYSPRDAARSQDGDPRNQNRGDTLGPRKGKTFPKGTGKVHSKNRASQATSTEGGPRKRKLINGQETLRRLLEEHPHLLQSGETADAAVAACFKKAAMNQSNAEDARGESAQTDCVPSVQEEGQKLSGSKRRKLLRLVMNSKTAEDKVFVHESYQLYNDILRSIRQAEAIPDKGSEGSGATEDGRSNATLRRLVDKAVKFLGGPLERVCVCVF